MAKKITEKKKSPYDLCKYFKKLYSEILMGSSYVDFIDKRFILGNNNSFIIISGIISEDNDFFNWLNCGTVRLPIEFVNLMRGMLKKNLINIEFNETNLTVKYLLNDEEKVYVLNKLKEIPDNEKLNKINKIETSIKEHPHFLEIQETMLLSERLNVKSEDDVVLEIPKKLLKYSGGNVFVSYGDNENEIRYVKVSTKINETEINHYFATI